MNKNENAEVSVTDDNKNNENSVSQMAENGCYLKCNSYSLSLLSSKQKSRSPITDEEIKELFMKMKSSGITPTTRLLHEALGRGSFTTIQKKLSELNASFSKQGVDDILKHKGADDIVIFLSNELAERAAKVTIKEDEFKIKSLNEMILKILEDHKKTETDMAVELDAANDKILEQQKRIEKYQSEVSSLTKENDKLKNQLSVLNTDSIQKKSEYEKLYALRSLLSYIQKSKDINKTMEELFKAIKL